MPHVGLAQISAEQDRATEVAPRQGRTGQQGTRHIGVAQIQTLKGASRQIGVGEVQPPATRSARKVTLVTVKRVTKRRGVDGQMVLLGLN